MAIFISYKVDFKTKSIIRCFITTKMSVYKENIILNACASKYTQEKNYRTKGKVNKPHRIYMTVRIEEKKFQEIIEDLNY